MEPSILKWLPPSQRQSGCWIILAPLSSQSSCLAKIWVKRFVFIGIRPPPTASQRCRQILRICVTPDLSQSLRKARGFWRPRWPPHSCAELPSEPPWTSFWPNSISSSRRQRQSLPSRSAPRFLAMLFSIGVSMLVASPSDQSQSAASGFDAVWPDGGRPANRPTICRGQGCRRQGPIGGARFRTREPVRSSPRQKSIARAFSSSRSHHVRFTANSGHWLNTSRCPLCAKSRHSGRFWILLLVGKGAQVRGASPMKLLRRQFLHLAASAAALPVLLRAASALDYPTRPVHIIVGYAPGGTNDISARLMGQWLSERLGRQFVIENRPGAASNLATEMVIQAPPDGYTLLLVNTSNAINSTLYDKLNFNFIRDVVPVAGIMRGSQVMVINPLIAAKSVAEFITYAKANPGKINMGSAGIGSVTHISGELFKMLSGVNLVHVPYRGGGPALVDLLGGQVQVMFVGIPESIEYIKVGRLRALAVTTAARTAVLPDIPTVGEFVAGYEAITFHGIGAPKVTPADIIDRLNKEINAGLADSELKSRLADLGGVPMPMTPADFGKFIADETEK